jgi:ubiquitin-activating enzyme E1
LGIEVAKNLILAGPKQVTLYDPTLVTVADLGRNFYIRKEHVGKISRAEASLPQLRDLNPNVHVHVATEASVEQM